MNLNPVFNLLSTPAFVLWEVAVLGPRASWARLCCANLSRGGTTRLPLFLFFFFLILSPFSLFTPAVLSLFSPLLPSATQLAVGTQLFRLQGSPGSKAMVRDHGSRFSWDKAPGINAEHGTKPQRVKNKEGLSAV